MARRPVNAPYQITTEFGVPDSYAKFGRHSGVDYAVPAGRPIYAPTSGQLENVVSPTGGNMVVIKANGLTHRLMHNSAFSRGNGWVNEGDQVATAGTTGLSTGVHSHWDINKEGTYPTSFASFIPPADFLAGKYNVITPSGGKEVANAEQVKAIYRAVLMREADPGGLTTYTGQDANAIVSAMMNSQERKNLVARYAAVEKALADTKTALANEQAKPPKEIVKIVEKIVEKPVITTVIDPTATAQIAETNKIVKWIQDVISSVFNRSK